MALGVAGVAIEDGRQIILADALEIHDHEGIDIDELSCKVSLDVKLAGLWLKTLEGPNAVVGQLDGPTATLGALRWFFYREAKYRRTSTIHSVSHTSADTISGNAFLSILFRLNLS